VPQIRLKKTINRDKWPSAVWGLIDYPNLVVYRNDKLWHVSALGLTEDSTPLAGRVLGRLERQTFPTRRAAVQALQVALILEDAESK
jgi:hypothetical protein